MLLLAVACAVVDRTAKPIEWASEPKFYLSIGRGRLIWWLEAGSERTEIGWGIPDLKKEIAAPARLARATMTAIK